METQLKVSEIVRRTAEALNRLANWGHYTGVQDEEGGDIRMTVLAKTEGRLRELARKKAEASGRVHDFEAVLEETKLEFFSQWLFKRATPMDPRVAATKAVEVVEEDEVVVCGVCQEELTVGEKEVNEVACKHRFHGFCLWRWLEEHKTCPMCRFRLLE